MAGLESDVIGGFNTFIENQRNIDGRVIVTAVLFDHEYELLWNGINAEKAKLTSREFSYKKVKEVIKHQQERYGWEFVFLGANINVAKEADSLGICRDDAYSFKATKAGVADIYGLVCEAVTMKRNK
ncbi:MAG: hypothetical protein WCS98_07680 [Bacillota bacterium]|jgi:hypothetical protein|nr:hypothetical protein [Bacillota bacterium]MDD3297920.1 hypothetical protein [Bacillota bacterium]MDD3850578.1 hypothetical protein [Bacillota bacterium]MDD4707366.1 hypothetical protein [Bacillota bacterium]